MRTAHDNKADNSPSLHPRVAHVPKNPSEFDNDRLRHFISHYTEWGGLRPIRKVDLDEYPELEFAPYIRGGQSLDVDFRVRTFDGDGWYVFARMHDHVKGWPLWIAARLLRATSEGEVMVLSRSLNRFVPYKASEDLSILGRIEATYDDYLSYCARRNQLEVDACPSLA